MPLRIRHDHPQLPAGSRIDCSATPCQAAHRSLSVKKANTVGGDAAIQRVTMTSLTGLRLLGQACEPVQARCPGRLEECFQRPKSFPVSTIEALLAVSSDRDKSCFA
jgi:hypothetical protein